MSNQNNKNAKPEESTDLGIRSATRDSFQAVGLLAKFAKVTAKSATMAMGEVYQDQGSQLNAEKLKQANEAFKLLDEI